MITGLSRIPFPSFISGFPYGIDVFGFEELNADGDDNREFAGNAVSPVSVEDFKALVFKNGQYSTVAPLSQPSFTLTVTEESFKFEPIAIPVLTGIGYEQHTLFKFDLAAIPGEGIKISWTPSTSEDFSHVDIFWDLGNSSLIANEFWPLASVRNKESGFYIHRGVTTGTHRYFIKFVDIYGNDGPDSGHSIASLAIRSIPTLEGTFDFQQADNEVIGSFTPTSMANVSLIKIFANFILGEGVLDYLQFDQAIGPHTGFRVPVGDTRLAAVGYDEYMMPSAPVFASIKVINDGTGDVPIDYFETPINVVTETLADGEFLLSFEDVTGNWDFVVVEVRSGIFTLYSESIAFESGTIIYTRTIDPDIVDGSYGVRIRAKKTVGGTDYFGQYSDLVDVLIDGTYPSGSTAVTLEAI